MAQKNPRGRGSRGPGTRARLGAPGLGGQLGAIRAKIGAQFENRPYPRRRRRRRRRRRQKKNFFFRPFFPREAPCSAARPGYCGPSPIFSLDF